jgi:membrane protein DedA with SNARE-associated domain
MSLEELISNYGYWTIAIGTFLEGETILVLGGFSAHRGYLELPWVMVCAFLGSFAGDQTFFFIGRFNGEKILHKRPHWQAKSERVLTLMNKHQTWLILTFRFMYGLRSVTPFLLGAAHIPPVRFVLLNMIGALIWAVVVGSLGYVFGYAFEAMLGDIKRYEMEFLIGLLCAGLGFWAFRVLTRNKAAKKPG